MNGVIKVLGVARSTSDTATTNCAKRKELPGATAPNRTGLPVLKQKPKSGRRVKNIYPPY